MKSRFWVNTIPKNPIKRWGFSADFALGLHFQYSRKKLFKSFVISKEYFDYRKHIKLIIFLQNQQIFHFVANS